MRGRTHQHRVIGLELCAFASIIALSWINELLALPQLIFGQGHRSNWPEAVIETVVVVLVAIPVLLLTRKILTRLHYLEGYLRVCAWCKRTECEGQWVPTEIFLAKRMGTQAPHGMCRACAEKMIQEVPGTSDRCA